MPSTTWTTCLLGLAAAAWASPAGATQGGPEAITPIGHDPVTDHVYVARHFHGEGDRPPELHRLAMRGPRVGQLERVCPWVMPLGPFRRGCNALRRRGSRGLSQRLAAFRSRWAPLNPIATAGFSLRTWALAPRSRRSRKDPDHVFRGHLLGVSVASRAKPRWRSFTRVEHFPSNHRRVHVARAFAIPERPVALVVVRYVGVTTESGYTADQPLLVRL